MFAHVNKTDKQIYRSQFTRSTRTGICIPTRIIDKGTYKLYLEVEF